MFLCLFDDFDVFLEFFVGFETPALLEAPALEEAINLCKFDLRL